MPKLLVAVLDSDAGIRLNALATLATGCLHQTMRAAVVAADLPEQRSAVSLLVCCCKDTLQRAERETSTAQAASQAFACKLLGLLNKLAYVRIQTMFSG